jgi:small-conductance mechanosensitive channel
MTWQRIVGYCGILLVFLGVLRLIHGDPWGFVTITSGVLAIILGWKFES